MATYKKPCFHCGTYIDGDVRICPACLSKSPFGYHCPTCLKSIQKGITLCDGCGKPLYVNCPTCGQLTFVRERCEKCGSGMMVLCENKRCGAPQFFQNTKCTACGKKMKPITRI